MYVLDTSPMSCLLNKIKSATIQDFKIEQNEHEIPVFMKHGNKYEFSIFWYGAILTKIQAALVRKAGFKWGHCDSSVGLEIKPLINFELKYLVQGKIGNLLMMGSWSF